MKLRSLNALVFCVILSACNVMPITANNTNQQESSHSAFEFALIGDIPYGVSPNEDYPPFDALVTEINNDEHIKWVLHAGDIKSGGSPCSNEMFTDRLNRYNAFQKPFILTLGDNEWTDCHRVSAGEFQPLERLAKLREIFYASPGLTLGGQRMKVISQAQTLGFEKFPENVRWIENNIVFATLHIVGSENGLKAFDENSSAVRSQADDEEVLKRTEAALTWLDASFAHAKKINSPGVFLMIHANPGLERGKKNRNGFKPFLNALEKHVVAFEKPVVLAHGDSHYFRIDKPALVKHKYLPNFTRVETFGAAKVNWLRIRVNPGDPEVFSFYQEIVN